MNSAGSERTPAARALLVLAIAWGALAFGAVCEWASVPLAVACATLGLAGQSGGVLPVTSLLKVLEERADR